MNDIHSNSDALLDTALRTVPRDLPPSRDLWPAIHAVIQADAAQEQSERRGIFSLSPLQQMAAGLVLMVLSSFVTYWLSRQDNPAPIAANVATENKAESIAAEYLLARVELDRQFAARLATLPPATRAKLESSLADLRRAGDELMAELARNPDNRLLQELLISTYQSEARLLADANVMPPSPI